MREVNEKHDPHDWRPREGRLCVHYLHSQTRMQLCGLLAGVFENENSIALNISKARPTAFQISLLIRDTLVRNINSLLVRWACRTCQGSWLRPPVEDRPWTISLDRPGELGLEHRLNGSLSGTSSMLPVRTYPNVPGPLSGGARSAFYGPELLVKKQTPTVDIFQKRFVIC